MASGEGRRGDRCLSRLWFEAPPMAGGASLLNEVS